MTTVRERASAGAWASNATLQDVLDRLRRAQRVVTLTHARPDGDAVGSTLALARAIIRRGGSALPVYAGLWSHRFDPIIAGTPTARIGEAAQIPAAISGLGGEPDAIIIADTGSWSQLTEARAWLAPRSDRAILIDHHIHGDADVAATRWIDPSVAAVCQTAAELCRDLLDAPSVSALPLDIATPLYLGLATDTGWFRHSNTTAPVMRLAAELLEAGVDHSEVFECIEQSNRPARLRLLGRAMQSLRTHAADRVAVITLSHRDFTECGADLDDAGGLGDMAMSLATVRASAVLTELEPGMTKVSLRSKHGASGPPVDVNRVAMSLGGGGHVQAAGAKISAPLEQARERVIAALVEAVS